MQPELGSQVVVPALRANDDSADQTNITAGNSAFLKFSGVVSNFTIVNSTGNDVYILLEAQTITAEVSKDWYHYIIPSGIPMPFNVAVSKIAVFVPAGGTTLEYKSLTKNFCCVGHRLSKIG